MHRLALLVLLFAPAVGAQSMYTPLGQGSVGLSGVFAGSLSDDFGNDGATLGLTLSGGNSEGADASVSIFRTPNGNRTIRTIALGAAVYVYKSDGYRVGPTLGVQHSTDGRSTAVAASIGAVAARQVEFGGGLIVPQVSLSAVAAVNGGGVQGSGGFAVAFVLPAGRARFLVEPAFATGFKGGGSAGSLRAGVVATL